MNFNFDYSQLAFHTGSIFIRHGTNVCTKTSSLIKKIPNFFYKQSIFFALNNEALTNEAKKNKDLTIKQKRVLGGTIGLVKPIWTLGLAYCIHNHKILKNTSSIGNPTENFPTLTVAILTAILEEIFFRSILQRGIAEIQKKFFNESSPSLQNNRVFRWTTSPSARCLIANNLFALSHLSNAGGFLSIQLTILQIAKIALFPTYSILYETTGDVIAPTFAHVTNNIGCVVLMNIMTAYKRR